MRTETRKFLSELQDALEFIHYAVVVVLGDEIEMKQKLFFQIIILVYLTATSLRAMKIINPKFNLERHES